MLSRREVLAASGVALATYCGLAAANEDQAVTITFSKEPAKPIYIIRRSYRKVIKEALDINGLYMSEEDQQKWNDELVHMLRCTGDGLSFDLLKILDIETVVSIQMWCSVLWVEIYNHDHICLSMDYDICAVLNRKITLTVARMPLGERHGEESHQIC